MKGEFETAFRQMLKSVVREVFNEVVQERALPSHPCRTSPTLEDEPRFLLRAREAAKRLAISERHLHKLTVEGVLPCVRVGRLVHYSVETIERWIRETESTDVPEPRPPTASSQRRGVAAPSASSKKLKSPPKHRSKAKASRKASEKQATPPAKQRHQKRSDSAREEEKRTGRFDLLLEEIGVDRGALPPLTNGDLMRIAEVDIPTLHGWQWHNRLLPDEALQRLKDHFIRYRKERDTGRTK